MTDVCVCVSVQEQLCPSFVFVLKKNVERRSVGLVSASFARATV